MNFLAILLLIFKNWKYVSKFAIMIDRAIRDGYDIKQLNTSLENIEKGFSKNETIKETATNAASINDAFRK